jgi:deoxycytidylate deaminase
MELTKSEHRFLQMAMGVALESKCRFRHGAVVVKHGTVLGSSPNIYKNDPKNVDYQHSQIHAEIAALKKAGWPSRVTVYVARVNGFGTARLSKPCANCQEVLDAHKVKVVWTE